MAFNESTTTGAAAGKSRVVKATPGKLLRGAGVSTIDCWIQLHDASSLPANGAKPAHETIGQANFPWDMDFGESGRPCSAGIVIAASSTPQTLTLIGTDSVTFNAIYL